MFSIQDSVFLWYLLHWCPKTEFSYPDDDCYKFKKKIFNNTGRNLFVFLYSYFLFFSFAGWCRGENRVMKFVVSRIEMKPTDHSSNCYFCMVGPSKRRTGNNIPAIIYSDIMHPSSQCHTALNFHVPTPPKIEQWSSGENNNSEDD